MNRHHGQNRAVSVLSNLQRTTTLEPADTHLRPSRHDQSSSSEAAMTKPLLKDLSHPGQLSPMMLRFLNEKEKDEHLYWTCKGHWSDAIGNAGQCERAQVASKHRDGQHKDAENDLLGVGAAFSDGKR